METESNFNPKEKATQMDRTFLKFYVKGNPQVQSEMVGDRSVQQAVENIRDTHESAFDGWEFKTLKLMCCMRVVDREYHIYENKG
jgi:hypothetical protein